MPPNAYTSDSPRYSPGMSRTQLGEYVLNQFYAIADSDSLLRRIGITRAQLRTLEADDEVAQCKSTHKDAVINVPWRLEPNQTRAAKKITAILDPWVSTLVGIGIESISYGYSVAQITWVKSTSGTEISSIFQCPLEWFRPTYTGDLLAATTLYWDDGGIAAQPGDSVLTKYPGTYYPLVREGSYTNPSGEAILSRLYFPVTWRRQGWGLWLSYLETFAQPIIVGQTLNYNEFVDAMKAQGIRSVVGYQTDELSKITTISGAQAGEFERLEQNLTNRIQKLYLGQTFSSGLTGTTGSYAAGKTLELVRQDKKIAAIRLITPYMQRICDTIADLNGLSRHRFVMADDTGLEIERAERDAKLLPVLTASGLQLTVDYFTDRYDYIDTDIASVSPAIAPAPINSSGDIPETTAAPVAPVLLSPATGKVAPIPPFQKMIDDIVVATTENIPSPSGLPIKEIQSAIADAETRSDLESRLKKILIENSDIPGDLPKAYLMGQVVGYVEAEKRGKND